MNSMSVTFEVAPWDVGEKPVLNHLPHLLRIHFGLRSIIFSEAGVRLQLAHWHPMIEATLIA